MFLLLAAEEEKAMAKKKLQSAAIAAAAAIAGFDQPQEWKQEVEWSGRLGNWNVRPAVIGRLTDSTGRSSSRTQFSARHFSFGQFPLQI